MQLIPTGCLSCGDGPNTTNFCASLQGRGGVSPLLAAGGAETKDIGGDGERNDGDQLMATPVSPGGDDSATLNSATLNGAGTLGELSFADCGGVAKVRTGPRD